MNGSNFKNETLFVSFTAIITTRNEWNGTNFDVGNRVVSSINMSRNRLVKSVQKPSSFSRSIVNIKYLYI